jgi:hypothetical protein
VWLAPAAAANPRTTNAREEIYEGVVFGEASEVISKPVEKRTHITNLQHHENSRKKQQMV